jgi:hypothetical protein
MNLTNNFTLEEMCATHYKINNVPTATEIGNLKLLCEKVLQPIRNKFGCVNVTSGFRCKELNIIVGGSSSSQHTKGEAADIKLPNLPVVFEWARKNLDYDQLINEYDFSWIHISYKKTGNRKQTLKAIKQNGKTVYIPC